MFPSMIQLQLQILPTDQLHKHVFVLELLAALTTGRGHEKERDRDRRRKEKSRPPSSNEVQRFGWGLLKCSHPTYANDCKLSLGHGG